MRPWDCLGESGPNARGARLQVCRVASGTSFICRNVRTHSEKAETYRLGSRRFMPKSRSAPGLKLATTDVLNHLSHRSWLRRATLYSTVLFDLRFPRETNDIRETFEAKSLIAEMPSRPSEYRGCLVTVVPRVQWQCR